MPSYRIEALEQAGCERVFTDHGVSGTRAMRPELDRMLDHLRPGQDEVVVWKLDRLGRDTRNLLALIDDLESRDIHFRSLIEGIATTGPMGTPMLTVMSAFAQLERDQLAERTKAGMAAAAEHGRKGRPPGNYCGAREREARPQAQSPGDQARRHREDPGCEPRNGLPVPEPGRGMTRRYCCTHQGADVNFGTAQSQV